VIPAALLRRLALVLLSSLPLVVAAEPGRPAGPACAGADPAALALLQELAQGGGVSFRGVVTLLRGDHMRIMQVVHGVEGDRVSERLTLLNGQDARIVRGDHPLGCIHPGQQLLRAATEAGGGCGVARYYRLERGPGERIAGRSTVRLLVQPRDVYRYGHVLEVDPETALVLKATTVGAGGRPLEQYQFASLSIGTGEEEAPAALVHEARHSGAGAGDAATEPAWAPAWVPGGFVATDRTGGARRSYTDGMAVFSVFLEQLARPMQPGEGVVREGSTVSYTRGMFLGGAPVLVTVIGEIPVNTARMVADSVRPVS
jgi:sigma-E factor negative regulatory protein RseB